MGASMNATWTKLERVRLARALSLVLLSPPPPLRRRDRPLYGSELLTSKGLQTTKPHRVFDTMFYDCITSQERACLGGLSPAEAQALASRMVEENEEKISNLRKRTCGLRRLYNSSALINAKLPVEILVAIFRSAGPSFGPKEAIWLTHVCHSWRTLIHGTPVYWVEFLYPPKGHFLIGNTMEHASVVLDAIARSAPMRIKMGLYGEFLPALRLPATEAHLSRIRILHLDCRAMDDRDMRPFFDISLPSLESLDVRMNCCIAIRPKDISAESPARFPRLRSLKTTCTSFPLAWVGAPLRVLQICAEAEEAATPREARHMRCCFLRSVPELFKVLGRCPDLEQLSLSGCLPCRGPKWNPDPAVPPPRLDRLAEFEIDDDTELTRLFLEYFSPPRETFIAICTDSSYDALSEFLSAKDTLPAFPLIHQVEVSACRPDEVYPHIVEGFAEAADGMYRARLAVLSSDKSVLHPWGRREARDTIDLLRFFRGFAPIFSPAVVVSLDIRLCGPVRHGQSEAWVWLLRYFPTITDLAVELPSSKDFSSALAQEAVVLELSNLQLTLIGAEDWAVADEAIVSALELRASRGVRLAWFVYRQQVSVMCGHATELPCPLPVAYVERLQAVAKKVTVPLPCYVD